MTAKHKIDRSGNVPLSFDGELISECIGRLRLNRSHNRYHDLAIYRTGEGRYIVAIQFKTLRSEEHTS